MTKLLKIVIHILIVSMIVQFFENNNKLNIIKLSKKIEFERVIYILADLFRFFIIFKGYKKTCLSRPGLSISSRLVYFVQRAIR